MVVFVFQTQGTLNALKGLKYLTARQVISKTNVENIDDEIYSTDRPRLSLQLVGHERFKVWQQGHATFVTINC